MELGLMHISGNYVADPGQYTRCAVFVRKCHGGTATAVEGPWIRLLRSKIFSKLQVDEGGGCSTSTQFLRGCGVVCAQDISASLRKIRRRKDVLPSSQNFFIAIMESLKVLQMKIRRQAKGFCDPNPSDMHWLLRRSTYIRDAEGRSPVRMTMTTKVCVGSQSSQPEARP